jgi:replicative DNA helicase
MKKPSYQSGTDVLEDWRNDLLSGTPPVLYPVGDGEMRKIEVGPKLITLLGGAPGDGKTAMVMQWVMDALRLTPTLRVCVCNVEMPPSVLLDRQLARLSGIDLNTIRYRRLQAEHAERVEFGMNVLKSLADRLCFVRPPFTLDNIGRTADDFEAGLIVCDYVQRIPPPGDHRDKRGSVDATMNYLRQFADSGRAIIVVAAVSRSKDGKGRSSYESLSLASFRESSELEFGADDAFILAREKDKRFVKLRHLKARNTEAGDLQFHFDRPIQRFTMIEDGKVGDNLKRLQEKWNGSAESATAAETRS